MFQRPFNVNDVHITLNERFFSTDNAFGRLIKSVEASGCKLFLQDALKIKHIRKSLEKQKKTTLFCPLDEAYNDYLKTWEPDSSDKKTQIYHHFTRQAEQQALIFESLLKGDKLVLKSTIENGQVTNWHTTLFQRLFNVTVSFRWMLKRRCVQTIRDYSHSITLNGI